MAGARKTCLSAKDEIVTPYISNPGGDDDEEDDDEDDDDDDDDDGGDGDNDGDDDDEFDNGCYAEQKWCRK